jgi:hypothetical protein
MTKKYRTTRYDDSAAEAKLKALLAELGAPEAVAEQAKCETCGDAQGSGEDCKTCAAERAKRGAPDEQTKRAMDRCRKNLMA